MSGSGNLGIHPERRPSLPTSPFRAASRQCDRSHTHDFTVHLTAVGIGGFAWEAAGLIWYEALKTSGAMIQFQEFADLTSVMADQLFGAGSAEQQAVVTAWREVGIRVSGTAKGRPGRGRGHPGSSGREEEEALAALTKQVDRLSAQVATLAKDVSALKGRRMAA